MADVDGANISVLLLRLFVVYFPQLIEAGMVYKAIPPLYTSSEGKKKKYFIDQTDMVQYVRKDFLNKHTFTTVKHKSIDNREITKFFLRNADYIYFLEKSANTYAVDPDLLEMVLFNYVENKHKIDNAKLSKAIKSVYRFMNVEVVNKQTVVSGSIASSNLIICSNKFFNDCRDIIKIIENNDNFYYIIDSQTLSLYNVMKVYGKSIPSSIQRNKGLGEMDYDELAESTLLPSNRTLIRYTVDDIKETTSIIREYESNSKKILEHVTSVTREDLIE